MPQYTTGELAKLCDTTVRTVQFYDAKDLLKPSQLTEGGRRLYSDDDLNKLRFICMLKALGLTLGTIKGILDSDNQSKVLLLLLSEQAKQIDTEIKDRQKQLNVISAIKENIQSTGKISVNSIRDIEHMMERKKVLKRTHATMVVVGLLMDIILISTVIPWITKGLWIPFAIGFPMVLLLGIILTRIYYTNTEYICAECNTKFRPTITKFIFSSHTPKTRKLTCPHCGYTGYCVEIGTEKKT
ncbi:MULTISPECIES: MerR family transcriptional regulator [Caproicibacterium]|uniref:MerR family transcriptional regulator n=1 Tax=Caproicibacterium argilliputei TaxID=3030016 RepID=A0AA97D7Y6_9FIRM|nr:MerR family transcriptional regulator [Caproicibacterium argilliputei]WOC31901.1 MerR family transcriptional regulator [Caproicibacterium argilliputei]